MVVYVKLFFKFYVKNLKLKISIKIVKKTSYTVMFLNKINIISITDLKYGNNSIIKKKVIKIKKNVITINKN